MVTSWCSLEQNRGDQMRLFTRLILPFVVTFLGVGAVAAQDVQENAADAVDASTGGKPNILIILIDDMGYRDVGYHGSEIRTPNIDRLASDGVELTEFYAHPTCSPTRSALMTAKAPARLGVVLPIAKIAKKSLPLSEKLLPAYLKDVGYQTALVGKWHLGHATRAMQPTSRGFDHFYGNLTGGVGHWDHVHGGGYDWQRNGETLRTEGYTTHLLTDEAVRVIKERDADDPLFLYLSYNAPHLPNEAPDETIQSYSDIENEYRRLHAAMVDEIDTGIGRVVAALKDEGMLDNTLIWFMSDNGGLIPKKYETGPFSWVDTIKAWTGTPIPIRVFEFARVNTEEGGSDNTPFRDGKASVYEGGVRVPSFIHWPAGLPQKQVAGRITVQDIFPTLIDAVGLPIDLGEGIDGASRWDVIADGAQTPPPDLLIGGYLDQAYYQGQWKLVSTEDRFELYDLSTDPTEQTDVAADHPEIVTALQEKMDAFPRGEIINPPMSAMFWDPDFFGGKEDRAPWADVVTD